MGSPPPAGSKKVVLMFRSVSSMVIPPAKTGRDRSKRMAVINTAQINKGMRSMRRPSTRMFKMVVIKFRAPRMEETPAK